MVLMIGMVMLLMLTLVAVGVIRMAGRHSQVVDNAQVRSEASAAGHYALDLVLNEPATTWDDLKTPAGRNLAVNLGTLGSSDSRANSVNVVVANMNCKRARIIKNVELVKRSGGVAYVDPGRRLLLRRRQQHRPDDRRPRFDRLADRRFLLRQRPLRGGGPGRPTASCSTRPRAWSRGWRYEPTSPAWPAAATDSTRSGRPRWTSTMQAPSSGASRASSRRRSSASACSRRRR
jgi:hypothetical protein